MAPSFAATVMAVGAFALVLSSIAPAVRVQRRVQPKLERARQGCVSVMGEARLVQAAMTEAKEAIAALDNAQAGRLARIDRCRRALQGYRTSFESASASFDVALARVEELDAIEPVMSMAHRGWGAKWRGVLEKLLAMKSSFNAMFREEAFRDAVGAIDDLYAASVELEVELALQTADVMTGQLSTDSASIVKTLRQMLEFCEEHASDSRTLKGRRERAGPARCRRNLRPRLGDVLREKR
jgi:hypothetical protein